MGGSGGWGRGWVGRGELRSVWMVGWDIVCLMICGMARNAMPSDSDQLASSDAHMSIMHSFM